MKSRLGLLVLLLLVGCVAPIPRTADYAIRFTRNPTVGERYHVIASGSDEQTVTGTSDGRELPPHSERLTVELVADCEILALTQDGRAAKGRMVIQKFVRISTAQTSELLPAGAVVVFDRIGEKTTNSTGGRPVAPTVAQALEILGMSLAGQEEISDDLTLGTAERKKIGDSWAVNAQAAAAGMTKLGIPVEAGGITGKVTLMEVINPEHGPLLRISTTVSLSGVTLPLPPGLKVQSCEMTGNFSGLYPVDPTQRVVQRSAAAGGTATASGIKDGHVMVINVTKKTSHEIKFSRN